MITEPFFEYTAVASGIIYVLLAARNNIWCWPAGIISSVFYIYINIAHHLFQDAILQLYYVAAGVYGWWFWHTAQATSAKTSGIVSVSLSKNIALITGGVLLVPVFGFLFSKLGNALSYFDATVTIFSFIATWMTAKKIIQNWLYWIAIDVVAGAMYYIKGLHATSGLYIIYAIVALYAYFEWKKRIKNSNEL